MITFWNRKEIYIGHSLERYSEICNILATNGMAYTYKIVDRQAHRKRSIGSIGMDSELRYMYYIYVHQKDFDLAKRML
ncbi:MAG: hypothetical protein E7231_00990 [Cellulosilyticum sp.]|nr:hypothetical protein [Cellulosilyticum sp.]